MKKNIFILLTLLVLKTTAQETFVYDSLTYALADGTDTMEVFTYQTGKVMMADNLATMQVPEGFKYLDAKQARFVLEEGWGNPADPSIMGMLIPLDHNPYDGSCWAITFNYEESGHVADDDAKDIDYADLLEEMQKDIVEENKTREKEGFQPYTLIGWAVTPFYDAANHKLHWAKELKFGTDSSNTLNYNIRVLGKEGVLVMNAIASMDQLEEVNANLDKVLTSVNFNDGNKYDQFDASVDKVAAYGIGGLIAGKVLAKVGFFALLLKFWKVIAIAVVAGFAALRKKIFGKKEEGGTTETKPAEPTLPTGSDETPIA